MGLPTVLGVVGWVIAVALLARTVVGSAMTITGSVAVRLLKVGIIVFSCSACRQPQGLVGGPIRISSDGREIVVALRKGEHSSIYAFPRNGGSGVRLTRGRSDENPALSPDGAMLAFVRQDGQGRGDVWMRDMKTGAESQLTATESHEGLPAFSHDGRRLWFGRAKTLRGGGYQRYNSSMDALPGDERLRETVELFELGVRLMRENLRRRFPDACDDEIEQRLRHWLHERPGAEQGDAVGRAVHLPRASG